MTLQCHAVGLPGSAEHSRITLRVGVGEFVGVVGGAGSGKSVLLASLAGRVRPARGEVTLGRRPVCSFRAQQQVGYVPDPPLLPRELTGTEWVEYVSSLPGGSPGARSRRIRVALETAGLGPVAGARIGTYSRTRLRQLAVAALTVKTVRVLVLDEALDGVGETTVRRFRREFARRRLMVVCSSRDLALLTTLVDRVLVLKGGALVADLPAFELRNRRVVELELDAAAWQRAAMLKSLWAGARRHENRLVVPLRIGLTPEGLLAGARAHRVGVVGSVTRPIRVEDLTG